MTEPASYVTTVRLTTGERDKLIALADKRGRTPMGALIREAISLYCDRLEVAEKNENGAEVSKDARAAL